MMSRAVVAERLTEALEGAQVHWQKRHAAAAASPTGTAASIALSREAGVRGTSIAHEVGARLGWQVYGHELVEEIAKQMGLRVSLVESVDERRRGWLQVSLADALAVPQVSESAYVRHLMETMLSLAAHGECVLVGRGSTLLLPPSTTLRVRLIATLEDRIATVRDRFGLGREDAVRWIEDTERERRAFAREHFRKDLADPLQYDLTLNTSSWSVTECAELIIEAVHRLESRLAGKGARS